VPQLNIFWDQLLQLIDEERVIPVIGRDLLVVLGDDGNPRTLYALLAKRLAEYLDLDGADLPEGNELNEVAYRYLACGGMVDDVYPALKIVAAQLDSVAIPEPLLQLASIKPFKLFVTTTFDSLLTRALNQTRFAGRPETRLAVYAPNEVQDLPRDFRIDSAPFVYYLLGKLSATPSYAVTQEDLVEFFHSLQDDSRRPPALFDQLVRQTLLILGCRFEDWVARFFMRMAQRQRLSVGAKTEYIAEGKTDDNLVIFLRHFSRGTKIYTGGGAVEFVRELHQRWTDRQHASDPAALSSEPAEMRAGAVFVSYASEDRRAAEKIKNALELAGMDVFFDRDDLQEGDQWDAKIRRNLRCCCLFMPVISHHCIVPSARRYVQREWNLAKLEAEMVSEADAFIFPIVIDDTKPDAPGIPQKFAAINWQVLPGGEVTEKFVDCVQLLYRKYQKSLAGSL
jgi:hypothetical protein